MGMGWVECDAFHRNIGIAEMSSTKKGGQQVQTFLRGGYFLPERFPVTSRDTDFVPHCFTTALDIKKQCVKIMKLNKLGLE